MNETKYFCIKCYNEVPHLINAEFVLSYHLTCKECGLQSFDIDKCECNLKKRSSLNTVNQEKVKE